MPLPCLKSFSGFPVLWGSGPNFYEASTRLCLPSGSSPTTDPTLNSSCPAFASPPSLGLEPLLFLLIPLKCPLL